jgi:hypothetical protein
MSDNQHGSPRSLAYGQYAPPGRDFPRKKKSWMARHKILIIIATAGVLAVAVASGIAVNAVHRSTGSSGCWNQSKDGSVVAESEIGRQCMDQATLILGPQEGGVYRHLPGPASHGELVCSVTPASGPNTWRVWTEASGADPSEAAGLCRMLQSERSLTVSWAAGAPQPSPQRFIADLRAAGLYNTIVSPGGYDLNNPVQLGQGMCTGSASPMVWGPEPGWDQIVSLAQRDLCPRTAIDPSEY